MRDFLDAAPDPAVDGSGINPQPMIDAVTAQSRILKDIRLALQKQTPDVLTILKVQGSNTIAAGDTDDHRAFFEYGGKPVAVYTTWLYSTFTGSVYVSINSMANPNDGLVFAAGDTIVLPVAIDSIHISTDGSADCPINGPADLTNGGFFIYGFTISEYDLNNKG